MAELPLTVSKGHSLRNPRVYPILTSGYNILIPRHSSITGHYSDIWDSPAIFMFSVSLFQCFMHFACLFVLKF